jgi:hypothetical protein
MLNYSRCNARSVTIRIYISIIFLLFGVALVCYLIRSWLDYRYPFGLDYVEGSIVWQAQHLTPIAFAFRKVTGPPYVFFHYTPLYHVLARFAAVFTKNLLSAGRMVSTLSTLGILIICGCLAWSAMPRTAESAARRAAALISAGLVLGLPSIVFARYMRVDMTALFFAYSGLYLFIAGLGSSMRGVQKTVQLYGSFLFFVLALYTKQTTIIPPLVCALYAIVYNPRLGLRLVTFATVIGTLPMALIFYFSHGGVVSHLITYNANPPNFLHGYFLEKANLIDMQLLAVTGIALPVSFAFTGFRRRFWLRRLRATLRYSAFHRFVLIAGLHVLLAFLFSFTCFKHGAELNYFLEWNIATCPLTGVLVGITLDDFLKRGSLRPTAAAIVMVPLLAAIPALKFSSVMPGAGEFKPYGFGAAQVLMQIKATQGEVLSEDMLLLQLAGKQLYAQPEMMEVLSRMGKIDERPMVEKVLGCGFGMIVIRHRLDENIMFSPKVISAIAESYQLHEAIGDYLIYTPKNSRPVISH